MRLKDLVEPITEKTDRTDRPYVALENIVSWDAKFVASNATTEGTNACFKEGDVLFGKLRPYLAKGFLPDYDGICSTEFFVMRPHRDMLGRYLLYWLLSPGFIDVIKNRVAGVKMPRTDWATVSQMELEPPSKELQRRIVAYLDEKTAAIDARVAVLEKKLAAYRRLKTSVINQAVTRGVPGWGAGEGLGERDDRGHRDRRDERDYRDERDHRDHQGHRDESHAALAAHCRAALGAKAPSRRVPDVPEVAGVPCRGRLVNRPLRDSGVDWIGKVPAGWEVGRFKDIAIARANLVAPEGYMDYPQIAPENIEKASGKLLRYGTVRESGIISWNHFFKKGQIIYSKIRPILNKLVIADFDGLCSADMYPIDVLGDLRFVFYQMLSPLFVNQVAAIVGMRVKMPKINQEELSAIGMVIPPVAEQRAIADYLDAECAKIDKAAELVTREIGLYRKLKRSLVNEVVTGKRKVAGFGLGEGLGLGERDDRDNRDERDERDHQDNWDHRDDRDESRAALAAHCRAARGAKAPRRRVPEVSAVSAVPEVSVVPGVPCPGRLVNCPVKGVRDE